MRNSLRFFIVIELLIFLFAVYQIITTPELLITLVIGIFLIYHVLKKKRKRSGFNNFELVLGVTLILIGLLSNSALWVMLVIAILFIGLKGIEISGVDITRNSFWRKKQMIMVKTAETSPHAGEKQKQQWFGNQRIGSEVYEWDDININLMAGDTIIDLGNTLLPKDNSVVIIRKGFGRTRILVPAGVGIELQHSTLFGDVHFDDTDSSLKNETIRMYSDDYDENPRKLKLLTNTLVGDVEVIRI